LFEDNKELREKKQDDTELAVMIEYLKNKMASQDA